MATAVLNSDPDGNYGNDLKVGQLITHPKDAQAVQNFEVSKCPINTYLTEVTHDDIEKAETTSESEISALVKPVPLIELRHSLIRFLMSDSQQIYQILTDFQNSHPGCTAMNVLSYINDSFEAVCHQQEYHDIAFFKLVHSYYEAATVTRNRELFFTALKSKRKAIDQYRVRDKHYIESVFDYRLYMKYLFQKKLGKAERCVQNAKNLFANSESSSWSGNIFLMEGGVYLQMALMANSINSKLALYDKGFQAYASAREHHLRDFDNFDMLHLPLPDGFYYKLAFTTLLMTYTKLYLPIFVVLINYPGTLMQNFQTVNQAILDGVEDAGKLLELAIDHNNYSEKKEQLSKFLEIAELYLLGRKIQASSKMHGNHHMSTRNLIEQTEKQYSSFKAQHDIPGQKFYMKQVVLELGTVFSAEELVKLFPAQNQTGNSNRKGMLEDSSETSLSSEVLL